MFDQFNLFVCVFDMLMSITQVAEDDASGGGSDDSVMVPMIITHIPKAVISSIPRTLSTDVRQNLQ